MWILTVVDPLAKQSKEFIQYLAAEFLKANQARPDKPVELIISYEAAVFPQITQYVGDEAWKEHAALKNSPNTAFMRLSEFPGDGSSANFPPSQNELLYEKLQIALDYADKEFEGVAKLLNAPLPPDGSSSFLARFEVSDPQRLKQITKVVNVNKKTQRDKVPQKKVAQFKFSENPPQVIFNEVVIPIPPNSIQLCACRVAFSRPKGEVISWDLVATEVELVPKKELKRDWHSVYDTLRAINKKVKAATELELFKVSKLSFYRLH